MEKINRDELMKRMNLQELDDTALDFVSGGRTEQEIIECEEQAMEFYNRCVAESNGDLWAIESRCDASVKIMVKTCRGL